MVERLIDPPIGFAHRGGMAYRPENTLAAFANAIAMGATGIETDAWLTADNQVVLLHDPTLPYLKGLPKWRGLGRHISRVKHSELPTEVPTLEQYFQECGTNLPLSILPLSIDVKDPTAFAHIIEVASSFDAIERLWLCSEKLDELQEWRDAHDSVKLVHSARHGSNHERHAATLAEAGINVMNLRRDQWTKGLVALYHRFGVHAFAWDAQQDYQIAEVLNTGVDAVYSDHVDRLMAAINAA